MKQYLVIGAGRFGSGVIKELHRQKNSVVVCDRNEKMLEEIEKYTSHCIIGDFKDSEVINKIGIADFDTVFVAIGSDVLSAILITKQLVDNKAKRIVAKAITKEAGEILASLGADDVVYPEEEAGVKAARKEMMSGVIEYLEISKEVSAIELEVPHSLIEKSLSDVNFSKKYNLNVALLIRNGKPILTHFADIPFISGDHILIIGENGKIEKFKKKFL